ncbi:hypothetical protein PsorP6_002142 [Peronosclerospora sorghi]|uniref:Uncharacterized protein n=1 Tax=Peronosclerospora sorghi TaxID=230839 RepID=A0ACC0WR75_9STRA|nr:hypothetical protein PsorP6_002142 [Peronosclerospora sorghi]
MHIFKHKRNLRVTVAIHTPIINICATNDRTAIIDNHELAMNVDLLERYVVFRMIRHTFECFEETIATTTDSRKLPMHHCVKIRELVATNVASKAGRSDITT